MKRGQGRKREKPQRNKPQRFCGDDDPDNALLRSRAVRLPGGEMSKKKPPKECEKCKAAMKSSSPMQRADGMMIVVHVCPECEHRWIDFLGRAPIGGEPN